MRLRRVLLCLPDQASEDVLALAQTIKASLSSRYRIRLRLPDGGFEDEDETPVEGLNAQPLILRIEDSPPPDGGEGTV